MRQEPARSGHRTLHSIAVVHLPVMYSIGATDSTQLAPKQASDLSGLSPNQNGKICRPSLGTVVGQANHTSVRRQLHRVAERIEGELGEEQFQFIEGCPSDWAKQPPPGPPLMVGLNGGYVHASDQKSRTEG